MFPGVAALRRLGADGIVAVVGGLGTECFETPGRQ